MSAPDIAGMVPVAYDAATGNAEWLRAAGLSFHLPYFRDAVRAGLADPARPRLVAPVPCRLEGAPARPALLVFGAGRSGATLLTRLLERPGQLVALREPTALSDCLVAHDGDPPPAVLSALIGALVRGLAARRVVLKLSSWMLPFAPAIVDAAGGAPVILLRRPPAEIGSSFRRRPAAWMDAEPGSVPGWHGDLDAWLAVVTAAAERLAASAAVIEHDEVPAASRVIAAVLGIEPLSDAEEEEICRMHDRRSVIPGRRRQS